MESIAIALSLLSGVALFLYGMAVMGDSLKQVAGTRLERILYKLTNTRVKGILLGIVVTALIQSSSATTVMVVGFVNSGMMKLIQAISVILGSSIGTSVTGWILCLSYIEGGSGIATLLSSATIAAIVAIVGIFLKKLSKHSRNRHIGDIMLGFAILMVGMQTMSAAMSPLRDNPDFLNILTIFNHPLIGILIGIVFTAILQSSSAAIGILQAISVTGVLTFSNTLPIILGVGIGASSPVLLSSIGTNTNGKRTAFVYLIDDMLGVTIWGSIFYIVNACVELPFVNVIMTPILVATVNSVYRVLTVCILAPSIKIIEKIVCTIFKESQDDIEEQADFDLLEERFLKYPELAISQSHKAMNGMAKAAQKNVIRSMDLLTQFSEERMTKLEKKENIIDKYEDKIGTYLMQLSKHEMNTAQTKQTSEFLHSISDFERLGDHAYNIAKAAAEINEKSIQFSPEARAELFTIKKAVNEIVVNVCSAFQDDDFALASKVEPLREWIGVLVHEIKSRHIARLQNGTCSIDQGFVLNDLLTNYERIAAHCSNIAAVIIELHNDDFESHQYLKNIREHKDNHYIKLYEEYSKAYSLD
ncbi:MAG: Na/Pi cotransporter family protein [Lachnospiraceae bacterium]|nr:Na/Pi cotransporter family protein [Lachnospiraceae bacterium]